MYKYIVPQEIAGLGFENEEDNRINTPLINDFSGWLGDDILAAFPCYIVSERLMNNIKKNQLNGIVFDSVSITNQPLFKNLYPRINLKDFYLICVNGKLGIDDFVIADDYRILVSEKGLNVITFFNIKNVSIENHI